MKENDVCAESGSYVVTEKGKKTIETIKKMEDMRSVCFDCGTEIVWGWEHRPLDLDHSDKHTAEIECPECGAIFWMVRRHSSYYKVPTHIKHFPTYFKMMLKEMDETFPEKGNSWLELDDVIVKKHYGDREIPMYRHLTLELEKTFHRFMERGEVEYLKHLGNFCATLRLRKLLREEIEGKEE